MAKHSEEPAYECGQYLAGNLREYDTIYGTCGNRIPAVCQDIELPRQLPQASGRGRIPCVSRAKRLLLHTSDGSISSRCELSRARHHRGSAAERYEAL